ncbi:hypothetical protein WH50_07680 [Pokkaliibacter plantistimulans]|uniref:CRISPR-associated protein Cmr3 n=1 Tax=Pokkaliibacter plantistimulans TaxID=1635171 RepID=A0ABX5LYX6_9GAMM|nr:type III-B CRISPR module-associated Cmr3 family protein [Pokkaliibacter plantistimulans]PXF31852.1 hypothetical protein WH50_07680 [Pokkaliibacter plantistimulans]
MEQWNFSAADSWFFKESRPIEAVGANLAESLFPPSASSVIGAIRSSIGEAHQVDWAEYAAGEHPLRGIIGTPDDLGPLQFSGPYLSREGQRLYPMPQSLLWAGSDQTRLIPADGATRCDLGLVRLPQKAKTLAGARPRENTWITEAGLQAFLAGQPVAATDAVSADALFEAEPRLGIGRDNQRATVETGLLYQTRHVRPRQGCEIVMDIRGLQNEHLPPTGICRFGAEGRMASWSRTQAKALPAVAALKAAKGLTLMLLTPASFEQGWIPDGFTEDDTGKSRVWRGELAGIRLTLLCAALGKPRREGGWDLVNRKPRDLQSLIPAGSVYFCEVEGDIAGAQRALHGIQIGQQQAWGRGTLAVGYY